MNKYGPKKWSTIAQHLPGRIGKQCRERYGYLIYTSLYKIRIIRLFLLSKNNKVVYLYSCCLDIIHVEGFGAMPSIFINIINIIW